MRPRSENGQSLVEVLIGLSISILIIGALINAVTTSLRNSQAAKNSAQATKFAQEGVEFIRSERDGSTDWAAFTSAKVSTTPWCLKNAISWPPSAGSCGAEDVITGTIFTREALIEAEGATRVKVQVTVKWKDQGGEHKSQLSTIFTDTSKWK